MFGISIVDEGEQGYRSPNDSAAGVNTWPSDIAPPPPPPQGQAGNADSWSNPYASSPPLVSAQPIDDGKNSYDWVGQGSKLLTGLVNIFGQPVNQHGQPVPVQQPHGMPLWGWVAIGVGGVVVLGVAARSLRSHSYAGYRRHRRSRR